MAIPGLKLRSIEACGIFARQQAGVLWTNSTSWMPHAAPLAGLSSIRAAPLTFAFLWSSGFIVAKYAAPASEPFTFLLARFGLRSSSLPLIAVASRAPWPPTARDAGHSVVAGVLLHGGYLARVWWAVAEGLPAGIAGVFTAGAAAAHRAAGRPAARRTGDAPAVVRHRGWVRRHRAGSGAAACRRSTWPRSASSLPMAVNFGAIVSLTLGTFYQKRFVARYRPAHRHLPAIHRRVRGGGAARARDRDAAPRRDDDIARRAGLVGAGACRIAAIALLLMMIRHGEYRASPR